MSGDVLAGRSGNHAAKYGRVEVALRPVGQDSERLGHNGVLPVGLAEQLPVASGVGVVLHVAEVVAIRVDVTDDLEDDPVTVQEVIAVTDGPLWTG